MRRYEDELAVIIILAIMGLMIYLCFSRDLCINIH